VSGLATDSSPSGSRRGVSEDDISLDGSVKVKDVACGIRKSAVDD
jgi:hypothetical protein